jgi:hypothetical protein
MVDLCLLGCHSRLHREVLEVVSHLFNAGAVYLLRE